MIRVLHVIQLHLGGAETTVMNYYRNIDRTKVQFDFLYITDEPEDVIHYYQNEAISLGARIFYTPFSNKKLFKKVLSLYKIFKENPEIKKIHIHRDNSPGAAKLALLSMIFGIKVRIAHSPTAMPQTTLSHKIFQPMLRFAATHWFAYSTEAGESLFGKNKWKGKKAIFFYNARDLMQFRFSEERRQQIRKTLSIKSIQTVLLNIGRLEPIKNQGFLLDAFAIAIQRKPELLLLFAGVDQGEKAKLIRKAEMLEIEHAVRFLGERDDIPELFQAADLFLLPSLHEGLPGVVIEAQAAGLPCLLSDTITKECKITELVEFLPINNGASIWADRIIEFKPSTRYDTIDEVKKAGFEIKDAAKKLEEFYLTTVEKS